MLKVAEAPPSSVSKSLSGGSAADNALSMIGSARLAAFHRGGILFCGPSVPYIRKKFGITERRNIYKATKVRYNTVNVADPDRR